MKILALDTATVTGSVALLDGQRLVAESLLNVRATHSERLLEQIRQVLHAGNLVLADLDLIAVVRGPGSFTGLRIGLATAKGLAQSLGLPLVGISSLQLLAMNVPLAPFPICAFLDARKKEVYTALFNWRDGVAQPAGLELVLPPEKVLDRLSGEVVLVGDAVEIYHSLIQDKLGSRAHFPAACHHQPRAAAAAVLAGYQYQPASGFDAAQLSPVYIRRSDAEINRS